MICRDWEERIALHAGGDLPRAEAAALDAHLAACEGCRAGAGLYGSQLELLQEAHGEPIDAAHYAAVRARVLAELRGARRPVWRWIWVGGALAVAAAFTLPWPRAVHAPERTEMAVIRPAAPRIEEPGPAAPAHVTLPRRARKAPPVSEVQKQPSEPLLVKLLTDDPNVVIYWIAD
jgi:anti-sigma factor RsiW